MARHREGHRGSFSEGMESMAHDDGRLGRYCDGPTAAARSVARVGRFSDGLGWAGGAEGRFSTGMERPVTLPELKRIRRRETAPARSRAA